MNFGSVPGRSPLDLQCMWTTRSCSLFSCQHLGAWVMPAVTVQPAFSQLLSLSMVFLHPSTACGFPPLWQQSKTRRARRSVTSLFLCIQPKESDCGAHFALKCLTDWPTSNSCPCVYRRWRTEGKGGCSAREKGTKKKAMTNPPSKSCFPTCGFKMLPPSPAIL